MQVEEFGSKFDLNVKNDTQLAEVYKDKLCAVSLMVAVVVDAFTDCSRLQGIQTKNGTILTQGVVERTSVTMHLQSKVTLKFNRLNLNFKTSQESSQQQSFLCLHYCEVNNDFVRATTLCRNVRLADG